MCGGGTKQSKPEIQNQCEEKIMKSIKNFFKLKKGNKAIKDRIVRDIWALFE